jgi:hypothetical protein
VVVQGIPIKYLVLYLVLSLIELVEECSLNYAVAVYYGLLLLLMHQLLVTCSAIDILFLAVVMLMTNILRSLDIELFVLRCSICISQNFTYKLSISVDLPSGE